MIQRHLYVIIGLIGFAFTSIGVQAAVDNHPRNMAASCAACHGTNGHSVGGMPVLAGMDKALFVRAMKDFKSGARPATVMHHHAKGYTDEEFDLLADYFAAQKR